MIPTLCLAITLVFCGLSSTGAQQIDGCDLCTRRVAFRMLLYRQVSYQVRLYRRVSYQVRLSRRVTYYVSTKVSYQTCTGGSWWRKRRCSTKYRSGKPSARYRTSYYYVTRYRSQAYYVRRYRAQPYYVTRYWTMKYCCVDTPSRSTMEGHVKLIDGPTLNEGRVMINYKQHYGAVCSDRFGTYDANTVCHQLGFAGQERITGCCPYGRRPHGKIWLDEVGCSSRDVWLANCTHRGWGVHDCHNGQEIGLKCHPRLNLRLSGGKHPFEGRVEQYYAGTWGTVCDDLWDMNNARVVCRQLGLGEAVKAVRGALFGQGRGYTMLSNVDCIGHESALGWCLHSGWRGRTCSHSKDAGVVCKGPVPDSFRAVHIGSNYVVFTFVLPKQLQFTDVVKTYKVSFHPLPILGLHITNVNKIPTNRKSVNPRFTITGLKPCTRYRFQVAIVASTVAGGTGPFSKYLYVATSQKAPGHVSSFSGHSVNSSCIGLSLKTPIMTGCNVVRYYLLSYRSLSGGGFHISRTITVSSPVANNKILVCGLRVNILYSFVIVAVNGAGKGPPTTIRIYHYDPSISGK